MRITLWDIETSMTLGGFFQLYDIHSIPYAHVTQPWFMLSASWKTLGDERSKKTVSLLDDARRFRKDYTDDFHIVNSLYKKIKETDVLVAHNGNRFDWPKFEQRMIVHKLPPIEKPMMVDTLLEARKFKFLSHKLDDLCQMLDLERKMNLEQGLWIMATQGDPEAIAKIAKYNARDIPPLEELYLTLRPYMRSHPNANLFSDGKCCPLCAGTHFKRDGYRKRGLSIFPKFYCHDCRKPFIGKHAVKRVDYRL